MVSSVPRLRSDLIIRRQQTDQGTSVILKNPVSGKFFRLGEAELFITQQLDGETSLEEIRRRTEARFEAELPIETLTAFLQSLKKNGILEAADGSRKDQNKKQKRIRGTAMVCRIKLCDPCELLKRLTRRLRFFFTDYFVVLSAAAILLGIVVTAANWSEFRQNLYRLYQPAAIPAVILMVFLVIVVHEFGHGMTCTHFGGEVHEMGFVLILLQPAFYCNVSDAWLFPEKSKRLWVGFAGPYFEMFLWALAVFTWRLTEANTWINFAALSVMATSGVKALLNFNPLIKLDGYYLLSDYLEIPNLRRRSFRYVGRAVEKMLGFESSSEPEEDLTPRERRVLPVYGTAALAGSFSILGYILMSAGGSLVRGHTPTAFLLSLALLGMKFQRRFRRMFAKSSSTSGSLADDDFDVGEPEAESEAESEVASVAVPQGVLQHEASPRSTPPIPAAGFRRDDFSDRRQVDSRSGQGHLPRELSRSKFHEAIRTNLAAPAARDPRLRDEASLFADILNSVHQTGSPSAEVSKAVADSEPNPELCKSQFASQFATTALTRDELPETQRRGHQDELPKTQRRGHQREAGVPDAESHEKPPTTATRKELAAPENGDHGQRPEKGSERATPAAPKKSRRRLKRWFRRFVWVGMAAAAVAASFRLQPELRVGGPLNILPVRNADIRTEIDGMIEQVRVMEGAVVHKGDLIAVLSTRENRSELDKTQGLIQQSTAKLRLQVAGPTVDEIEVAKTAVVKAKDNFKYASAKLDATKELYANNLSSRIELETAKQLYATAKDDLDDAEGKLKVLQNGTRREEIDQTKAEIAGLTAQERFLEGQIVRAEIRSPVDGIIATPELQLREMAGQVVQKGALIAKVFELRKLTVEIAVPEGEIADVKVGQPVELKVRAYPNQTFSGKVISVATSALSETGAPEAAGSLVPVTHAAPTSTTPPRTILVTTEIDNSSVLLKPGMTGHAKIFCGRRLLIDIITRRLARTVKVEFWSWH